MQNYSFTDFRHVYVIEDGSDDGMYCNMEIIHQTPGLDEKCLTVGWYEFAKNLGLSPGDKLCLVVVDPVECVCVRVERSPAV